MSEPQQHQYTPHKLAGLLECGGAAPVQCRAAAAWLRDLASENDQLRYYADYLQRLLLRGEVPAMLDFPTFVAEQSSTGKTIGP
jgi:hypothetical protein